MMLDVVSRVAIPPRIVPKASGMSSFEGGVRVWRERAITAGMSTPAAAMLFMNRESIAAEMTVTNTRRGSLRLARRNICRPRYFVTPD